MFEKVSDIEFEEIFMNIIDLSSKANTYKFAFMRFLLEYCKTHNETHVDFFTISEYFLKYYWIQECKSKLKQSPQSEGNPEVIKIIQKEFQKAYYPQSFVKIREKEPEKIKKCIERIRKMCFHDVTWRLQNVKYGKKSEERKIFFDYKIKHIFRPTRKLVNLEYGIVLNPDAMSFFKRYNTVLNKAVTLEWAKFLEKLNLKVPQLISKTEGKEIERGNLKKFKDVLEPFFKNCFYCNNILKPGKETHVEHVIPFDFIREDNIWNFTLACQSCNCKKLGSLPPEKYLNELIKRNKNYRKKIPLLEKSLLRLGVEFEKIIQDHYWVAKSHGYMILKDFP